MSSQFKKKANTVAANRHSLRSVLSIEEELMMSQFICTGKEVWQHMIQCSLKNPNSPTVENINKNAILRDAESK